MYNMYEIDSPGVDWRLPENRLEAFRRVTYTRFVEGDMDMHHTAKVIIDRMELNLDQQALFCMLYGQSYRNHWAMIVLSQFPNLLDVPEKELKEWHDENWKRCFYAKDTKWGVRKFPAFVESIKRQIGDSTPYDHYYAKASIGSRSENFYSLNEELTKHYGIGRMTAWLAQQTFFELFDWDIDHWDLQLYGDTWSQFDALCYLFNREDLMYLKEKKSKDDIKLMEKNVKDMMIFLNDGSPFTFDIYNIESCLCEYRKTASPRKKPKEFTFWASAEMAMQYEEFAAAWPEIDWEPYVIGMMTKGENARKYWFSKQYFNVVLESGMNLNTHYHFPDEPNAYEILNLPKEPSESTRKLFDDWNKIPNHDELLLKYDPMKYLKWKKVDGL